MANSFKRFDENFFPKIVRPHLCYYISAPLSYFELIFMWYSMLSQTRLSKPSSGCINITYVMQEMQLPKLGGLYM